MTAQLSTNFMSLLIGFLMGAGSLILLISRLDRTGHSGCFYGLLLGIVIAMTMIVLLGASGV